jgi:hypothetical protein
MARSHPLSVADTQIGSVPVIFLRVPVVVGKARSRASMPTPRAAATCRNTEQRNSGRDNRICGLLLCCCRAIYRRPVGSDLFGRVVGSELRLNSASTAACRKRVPSRLTSQLTIVCHISASASTGLFRRRCPSRRGPCGGAARG